MWKRESKSIDNQLISAVIAGDLRSAKLLVEAGAEKSGLLTYAVLYNHLSLVKYLMEGCNIGVDENGYEALISASELGKLEIVQYLIVEKDCNPEFVLLHAQKRNQKEVIEWCQNYIENKKLNDKLENQLNKKSKVSKNKV